jgi:V8-like Glu-specific endopeptidase
MDIELMKRTIDVRKKFNRLIQKHRDLKFMEDGNAGRIHFDIIPTKNEEQQDIIHFRELGRAPIIDIHARIFGRSFPLSVDYKLLENTKLFGNSPKEEIKLFINRDLINKNPIEAVVSLLSSQYGATAFRVSPKGGLITCYHCLSTEDNGPIEELWIHRSVVSNSLSFAASEREKVEYVPCTLPLLDNNATDPLNSQELLSVNFNHSDIAFLRSSPGKSFLIPCVMDMPVGETVVCIGYPRKFTNKMINDSYCDIIPEQIPDKDEYHKLFTVGNLSISPGPLLGYNSSALACKIATIPGFSGSPVCMLKNPRMFSGVHYRCRDGSDYALSISVQDPGFYHLYSTLVVPELRDAELCQEDIDAINNYLSIGETKLITNKILS